MLRYAGLLIRYVVQEQGGRITRPSWVVGPAYRSGIWPTVISGILKSTKVSHPYNQGRKHTSMVAECGGRVHSGGLPTLTVHKYSPYLTVIRSQSKRYKVRDVESHREQSGRKSRVSAFVSKSYLECSWCLLVSGDRCNPGHHYIRWHREP
jgi:hypothetical protein